MTTIAEKLVEHIASVDFQYRPRRGPHGEIVKTWPERLRAYRWGAALEPFADFAQLKALEEIFAPCAQNLVEGGQWSEADKRALVAATQELFTWGRVLRGKGHANPSVRTIETVIRTALEYEDVHNAPLDSAWTKLAAISTARSHRPQVIFDSRVSVSLLRAIDAVCKRDPTMEPAKQELQIKGLGFVPGRGGNRMEYVKALQTKGWRCGYRSWGAQFAASDLVRDMANALNDKPEFGKMPLPDEQVGEWTTRGVEMVLFMDGY